MAESGLPTLKIFSKAIFGPQQAGLFLVRTKAPGSDFLDIFHHFVDVANVLQNLALGLVLQPFGLLRCAAYQFARFFLDFPGDVFDGALDLVLVHKKHLIGRCSVSYTHLDVYKRQGFSNWELSANRANAARREMIYGGMDANKVLRVLGLSSSVLFDKNDPLSSANRRINIVVLNKRTEEAILQEDGNAPIETDSASDTEASALPDRPDAKN